MAAAAAGAGGGGAGCTTVVATCSSCTGIVLQIPHMHARHAHARVHMHIYNREEQQTRLGSVHTIEIKQQSPCLGTIEITADPLGKFCPHTLPRTLCPGAGGGWISPTQPPPFERHPHPAEDEGNATAEVAPSGLGQCHVVEPESAHTRPGSLARTTHTARGCSSVERAQMWSVMRRVRVTLPLHYRYITVTVTLPLHHRYITVTLHAYLALGGGCSLRSRR